MKTSDFISSLGADDAPPGMGLAQRYWLALALGGLASVAAFMAIVGPRADFMAAAQTIRFDLKFLVTLSLLLPAALLGLRLLRPEAKPGALAMALAAPAALLAVAVVAELAILPADQWLATIVGDNAMHCLRVIPMLSIAPLAALIFAMRAGAPSYPALTGALAGAASAGLAATLYASNCPDDSPLFVATWYPLASAIVAAAGALAGRLFLRW